MTSLAAKARRLVGLFLLGAVLFNYPVLSLFDRDAFLFGIPVLYLYLFGVWALLILLTAKVTASTRSESSLDGVDEEGD
jgi:predicted permease